MTTPKSPAVSWWALCGLSYKQSDSQIYKTAQAYSLSGYI